MQVKLTSIGRKSGEPRTVTLYAWPDGEDRLVLVASQAGKPDDPAWAFNLRADPVCTITRGRTERRMRADEVPAGPERDRLWDVVVEAFPDYAVYQTRTSRQIPLFVLVPAPDEAQPAD